MILDLWQEFRRKQELRKMVEEEKTSRYMGMGEEREKSATDFKMELLRKIDIEIERIENELGNRIREFVVEGKERED